MNAQQRRAIRREQRATHGKAPAMRMEAHSPELLQLAIDQYKLERSIKHRDVAAAAVGIAAGAVIVMALIALLSVLL